MWIPDGASQLETPAAQFCAHHLVSLVRYLALVLLQVYDFGSLPAIVKGFGGEGGHVNKRVCAQVLVFKKSY